MSELAETFDAVVVGGGPAGATAAWDLARANRTVLLLDRAGRIKPCGGAIPPRLIEDFDIPEHLIVARSNAARMVSPSNARVIMPIEGGSVGMVDREHFDEWLRARAEIAGAKRCAGEFIELARDESGVSIVKFRPKGADKDAPLKSVKARLVIGADGAKSKVAQQALPGGNETDCVFAYHEIIESPAQGRTKTGDEFDAKRCDIYYQGRLSPDFYAWVFPHGETTSVGVGSAQKGFSLRGAVGALRHDAGLDDAVTIRREGAPIPLKPLRKWDNGRDVLIAGDSAGCVAPASGEGIYYAMVGGREAAIAGDRFLATGDARMLAGARRRYMREHGKVFFILRIMQHFWYRSDKRRERFVAMCEDKDVQKLTWDAYMNKRLVRAKPAAHIRIFMKDMAHLLGLASVRR